MNHPPCPRAPQRQRGVALLLAMIVVALVTAAAAAMVWQQERAVAVEGAERARAQSAWILNGALDWARLILREDERASRGSSPVDSLDEPWAQPLAEARLSSFLAADRDNNADSGPEAFISGTIEDAQSRFNLRGVVDAAGQIDAAQLAALTRLVELAGAPADAAARLVQALRGSELGPGPAASGQPATALRPKRWRELAWFGIDEATLARLAPYVDLLPQPTPVNVNTAPREVLAAVIEQLDLGGAERIVQQRQRQPFRSLEALQPLLPPGLVLDPKRQRLAVASQHFHVAGRLRLEQRVLEERSLLERRDGRVEVLLRDRHSFALPAR